MIGIGPVGHCPSLIKLSSGGLNYAHISDLGELPDSCKWVLKKTFQCFFIFKKYFKFMFSV